MNKFFKDSIYLFFSAFWFLRKKEKTWWTMFIIKKNYGKSLFGEILTIYLDWLMYLMALQPVWDYFMPRC